MRALIFNNTVVQLADADFEVSPTLTWMDAPEGCEVGWQLVGGVLQSPSLPEPSNEELIALYAHNLKELFFQKAIERQYDSEDSITSYVTSTNLTWATEAADFIAWRDSCWEYAYNIQTQVEQGQMNAPTLEEFLAGVPELIWN